MKAWILPESWEKQRILRLENGWKVTEEHGHYGTFVKRLDSPDGKMWLCCNGTPEEGLGAEHYNKVFGKDNYIDLPAFASGWKETTYPFHIRPGYDVQWNEKAPKKLKPV